MGDMANYYLDSEDPFDWLDGQLDYEPYSPIKIALASGVKCPKCRKGKTVVRTNSKTNQKFCGCSRFPDCKLSSPLKGVCL